MVQGKQLLLDFATVRDGQAQPAELLAKFAGRSVAGGGMRVRPTLMEARTALGDACPLGGERGAKGRAARSEGGAHRPARLVILTRRLGGEAL